MLHQQRKERDDFIKEHMLDDVDETKLIKAVLGTPQGQMLVRHLYAKVNVRAEQRQFEIVSTPEHAFTVGQRHGQQLLVRLLMQPLNLEENKGGQK